MPLHACSAVYAYKLATEDHDEGSTVGVHTT